MGPFFWPKISVLVQKSDFCHTTPILVDDPFLALGMTVNFPPWDRFFDFPFRSCSSFCKKNLVDTSKSLPPPHRLPVTTLALSARRLDNMGLEKGIGGLKAQNLPRSYRFIPSSWTFEVNMVSY